MYVVVDALWQRLPPAYKRGSGSARSQVGYRHLFPQLPERSRFNRRRSQLRHVPNAIRQVALAILDVAQERRCTIDSLPVPMLSCQMVPSVDGTNGWRAEEADFGTVPPKQQTSFGYKLPCWSRWVASSVTSPSRRPAPTGRPDRPAP